ncbi:MAG: hypothetical protein ABH983_03720 [Candidatus Micrarchaeota archaeon]
MRQKTRSIAQSSRSSTQEPLAEGLQITVPTDSIGRRLWSKMSDTEIVEHVTKMMEERGISGKTELRKADSGLYYILIRREVHGKIGFDEKRRPWKDLSDEELVEYVRKVLTENEITEKGELYKLDSGLYSLLQRRGLIEEIGFVEKQRKRRSWKRMGDEEIVEYARKMMEENGITKRKELENADSGLYNVVRKRGLLDRAFAGIEQQKTDQARDAVIDALEAFAANDNNSAEDDVA